MFTVLIFGGNFFSPHPRVRLARFVLVFAMRFLPFVFGVEFVGLLEDPTFSVGMIGWFIRSVVDLAGPV